MEQQLQLPEELNFKFSELSLEDNTTMEQPSDDIIPHEDEQIVEMELPNIKKREVNEDEIFDKSISKDNLELEPQEPQEPLELPTPREKKPRKKRTAKPNVVCIPQVVIEKPPPEPIKEVIIESNEPPYNPQYRYDKNGKVIRNKNGSIRMKRQYTEEQKKAMTERLAKARANRNKNTEQKIEEKRLKKIQEERRKELMKKKQIIEEREIEEKMKQHELPPEQRKRNGFSKSDIEEIQLDAITKYETLRKQRKEKKRQEELIKQERENIRNVVKRQIGYKEISGIYSGCF